jgi:hypothetical protein
VDTVAGAIVALSLFDSHNQNPVQLDSSHVYHLNNSFRLESLTMEKLVAVLTDLGYQVSLIFHSSLSFFLFKCLD